ncbi:CUL5 isoform 6, partial [Pan troglodytes]
DVHAVCLWDDKGPAKIHQALKEDILEFIKQAQALMLDTWNESIFSNIKNRLQDSAMKLVHAERLGEAFDSQLVIGVRESYVNLCSNPEDKLQIYRDNFEKAYLDSTERFYRTQAPSYLQQNGVQNYMKY